ncbi:MAG TPA: alpha/beta hydrolase [Salinarimonas sp.]|nr:alpha/beta hydrolase [Salinarimonas sp.]
MPRLLLVLLLALVPLRALANPPLVIEETALSVEIGGEAFRLPALVVKEAGAARRLPVALITHGQAADEERRSRVEARAYLRTARDFARRGWLAVVVVRRGFGRAEGDKPFALRGCRDGDYGPAVEAQADDLEAALKAIARRPDADPERAIVLGVSVGGAAALAMASRPVEGLRGVINVSGGMRSLAREGRPTQCRPEDLGTLFERLGAGARVPSLWLYAENDLVFPADLVRRLHESYVARGGRTDFHMLPPVGADGHEMFASNDGLLRVLPAIDRYLRANRLPTYDPAPIEAALKAVNPNGAARAVFQRYAGRPTEKALAASPAGRYVAAQFGGADLAEVEAKALAECARQASEPCRVVLRNFTPVPDEGAKPAAEPAGPQRGTSTQ